MLKAALARLPLLPVRRVTSQRQDVANPFRLGLPQRKVNLSRVRELGLKQTVGTPVQRTPAPISMG
jgi:hypothetical protein